MAIKKASDNSGVNFCTIHATNTNNSLFTKLFYQISETNTNQSCVVLILLLKPCQFVL